MTKPGGSWCIEAAVEDWGGKTWDLVDDRGGRWGTFSNRITATACVAGFKAIGFVPRPSEVHSTDVPT